MGSCSSFWQGAWLCWTASSYQPCLWQVCDLLKRQIGEKGSWVSKFLPGLPMCSVLPPHWPLTVVVYIPVRHACLQNHFAHPHTTLARNTPNPCAPFPLLPFRTSIVRWHLSRTRTTAGAIQYLAALPALEFLDLRGTGIPTAALLPLERRFNMWQPQSAVLARSNALAAAAVGGALFPCCCAAVGVPVAPEASQVGAGSTAPGRACFNAGTWQRVAGGGVVRSGERRSVRREGQQGQQPAGLYLSSDEEDLMLQGIVALLRT